MGMRWNPDGYDYGPDGNGVYTMETTALPAGQYEAKAAIHESWNENYGAGGAPNGPNIPFTVPTNGAKVDFSYDSTSHVLSITAGHAQDGTVIAGAAVGIGESYAHNFLAAACFHRRRHGHLTGDAALRASM